MTVSTTKQARLRVNPVSSHAYRLPVVRELRALPPERGASRIW